MPLTLTITAGDHDPPLPFMVVERHGMHVDLTHVQGQLWDPTIASLAWGPTMDGREGGKIVLKNGQTRTFWDRDLLTPYLNAWKARKAELEKRAE
jgi:hypothetical protein